MSCPSAPPAVSTPVTSPRRWTNQRPVTVATNASAIEPVPSPTSTPQQQDQLAGGAHEHGQAAAGRDEQQRDGDDTADPEPLHQGGGERRGEPEQDQVHRDGGRDRAQRPAELGVQRVQDDAGRRPEAGRAHQRDEGDGGDGPGGVQASGHQPSVDRRSADLPVAREPSLRKKRVRGPASRRSRRRPAPAVRPPRRPAPANAPRACAGCSGCGCAPSPS